MRTSLKVSVVLIVMVLPLLAFPITGCAPEPSPPSEPSLPPELISLEVLDTLGIAKFDTQATEYITNYVELLPPEGLLDTSTKQKLRETLILDAFEAALVSQATSLRWDPAHPVHVGLEHARQAVAQAATDTEGTGAFCGEAESIRRGKLEGKFVFFYTADYLKYGASDLTPDDISSSPHTVIKTFYSPFLEDKRLIELMGLDSAAVPLQSFAWKMKIDIVAGRSAEELIQWYESSGFEQTIMAWPALPSQ